ncbi:MAG: glycosyltransferase [Dehalococcoidia bacterium]
MERIHVLWLIKGLGAGGAEQLLVQLAKTGDRERFAYRVAFVVADKDQLVEALTLEGIEVIALGRATDRGPRWLVRVVRLLAGSDDDIVHAHSPLLAAIARCRLRLRRRRDRPAMITTEHNRWGQYRLPTRWLNRLTYAGDDATIAVSDGVRETVSARYRAGVQTIHHGIDLDVVRALRDEGPSVRRELDIADDRFIVGTVANLRREKAYEDLLQAAAEVVRRHPDVIFVSVGQGPEEARLLRLHRDLGLGDRFRFLGYRRDAQRVMSAFDLFTLSSHHEGLPVTVMEAQAIGLPIVATAVGGLPEVIQPEHDGLLVPPSRPSELAGSIERLVVDDELRTRMGRAASERSSRFDARRASEAIEDIYEGLAPRRRGTR